jgi:CRP-like cAMP-binding protein
MTETTPVDFFTFMERLEPIKRQEVLSACKPVRAEPRDVICEQGEPSDSIYVMEKGVVEVLSYSDDRRQNRSLAYLSRGDIFGEMGILTGQPRVATIRACEKANLRRISDTDFLKLLNRIPSFGYFLCSNLAYRLHRITAAASHNSYCVDFGGNLLNFDLILIFQTIITSGQTGELRLISPNNDLTGSFFFNGGRIVYSRFAHLQAMEALWQVFLESPLAGTFAFRDIKAPTLPFDSESKIDREGMELLMQAATKRDHFQCLPEPIRKMQGTLERVTENLSWRRTETAPTAEKIWQIVQKRPQVIETIWRRLNVCSLTFAEVIQELTRTEQARII